MSLNHLYEPYPEPEPLPICPVCEEETNTFYKNYNGDIIGCDSCIAEKDAWEWKADQAELEMGRIEAMEELKHLEKKEMEY